MRAKNHRNQFTFYASYYYAIQDLPVSRRYQALDALILYALEGVEPTELKGSARGLFTAIKPNLDSSRVKAETALRKARAGQQEASLSEAWQASEEDQPRPQDLREQAEGPFSDSRQTPAGEERPRPMSRKEQEQEKKNETEYEKEGEKERENKKEGEKETGAREGGGAPAAAAEVSSGLSLPDREKKQILLRTPLAGRPPYAAMFREDPMLLYFWKDLVQPEPPGMPLPESKQRVILSELLALPVWERPAHLTDRLKSLRPAPKDQTAGGGPWPSPSRGGPPALSFRDRSAPRGSFCLPDR